ncbi:PRC-barrel domain-containing protein [Roseibium sp.]|uniref:PRC-barrel domain-containing protein n=1 Tax=Roseibium sp. TaxID=1936156 RepID=UPI003A9819BA
MRTINTILAGLFATTALVGAANAASSGDANGEVKIMPSASTQAEVKAEGDATAGEAPEYITGDANGETKVMPGAAANAEAMAEGDATAVETPETITGDANGDQTPLLNQQAAAMDMDMTGYTITTVDGESVGEVASVNRDASGNLISIEAEVGGFLGIGADTVTIPADRFTISGEELKLNMSEAEVKVLADS